MGTIDRGRQGVRTPEKWEWRTPTSVFAPLHERFSFVLDAAATKANSMAPHYIDMELDTLVHPWTNGMATTGLPMLVNVPPGSVWMNSPWGAPGHPQGSGFPGTGAFVRRGIAQAQTQSRWVVVLTPAATDAGWWREAFRMALGVLLLPRVDFLLPSGTPMGAPPGAPTVFVFAPTEKVGGPLVDLWGPGEPLPAWCRPTVRPRRREQT